MPEPTCQQLLDELLKRKAKLLGVLTSGVQEIEQPQLGRTAYRTLDEVEVSLRYVDSMIADLQVRCGATTAASDPNAWMKRRRPIYPVVTEV